VSGLFILFAVAALASLLRAVFAERQQLKTEHAANGGEPRADILIAEQ
jgi:hypothetical protein